VIVKLDGAANDGADTNSDGVADEGDNVKPNVEHIQTGSGNDTIDARFATARSIAHSFTGNFGNDKLYGGDEADSLYAGQGNDTVDGGDSADSIDGSSGADQITGGEGNDNIYPGDDNDTVNGSGGDDYMDAGGATSGADSYAGGTGFDRVTYSGRSTNLYIAEDNQPNDGTDTDGIVGGEEGDNVRTDVEEIDSGSGNDLINLSTPAANVQAADNTVYGSSGADTIKPGNGADYVDAGDGADKVTGGPGEDTVYGDGGADAFTMNDGFYDYIDGGSGDGVNDTGQFDAIDQKVNFP
jgi:Ca2+-binding RTX toxin-like protein